MIGKPIRKKAIYIKLQDYVEGNGEKQKGRKQKTGRNKVRLCR